MDRALAGARFSAKACRWRRSERRFGRHEATVAYWVEKHGLAGRNREQACGAGRLAREELEPLVERGLSIAEIAEQSDRSRATVRHWLRHYGLKTCAQRGRSRGLDRGAKAAGRATVMRSVPPTRLDGVLARGARLLPMQAMSHGARQSAPAQDQAASSWLRPEGAACSVAMTAVWRRCTSITSIRAASAFHLSMQGVTRSLAAARAEMAKCVLLCANCHAEVEAGLAPCLPTGLRSTARSPRIPATIRGSSTGRALDC